MSEPSLLKAFLRGEIDHSAFRHADHVLVGFDMLRAHDFATAFCKITAGLKAVAARAGNPDAYHATITLAFLALIAERSALGCFETAEDFVRGNPDVMDKTVLERWYAPERLRSDIARRVFILPEVVR